MRSRPNGRTWTLAALDPGTEYRLWFNQDAYRWEVSPLEGGEPLRTRSPHRGGSQRSESRRGAATVAEVAPRTDAGEGEHRWDDC